LTASESSTGVKRQTFPWMWSGRAVSVAYDTFGVGPPCLLLPAFSTVCTREEMRPLGERLAACRTVTLVDWPGFGESSRQPFAYGPVLMRAFLGDFLAGRFSQAPAVVAAGHAAGIVLGLARQNPRAWSCVVLVAPTWRGPLPTAMGRPPEHWAWVRSLVRAPVVGPALYRLNTAAPVIALMYRRHVYANRHAVTRELLERKQSIARRPRARFGSVAFVTGGLDSVTTREAFHALLVPPTAPLKIVYGTASPPRSRAEIEALPAAAGVEIEAVAGGSLGMHEELPDAVFRAIAPFLDAQSQCANVGAGARPAGG
jgi:pimeloyl-ACP methyl ester carboxylesterase